MERNTRQKQAVLQAIQGSGGSLSPSEICIVAQTLVPTLNLSTVYRQLKILQDEAQIVRVDIPAQAARFEVACPVAEHEHDHHHHHFHCTGCERVFPIHACPGAIDQLLPPGFTLERHDLILHGRCDDCRLPKRVRSRPKVARA